MMVTFYSPQSFLLVEQKTYWIKLSANLSQRTTNEIVPHLTPMVHPGSDHVSSHYEISCMLGVLFTGNEIDTKMHLA